MRAATEQLSFPRLLEAPKPVSKLRRKPVRKVAKLTAMRPEPAPFVAAVLAPQAAPAPSQTSMLTERSGPPGVVEEAREAWRAGRVVAAFGLALGGAIPWLTFRTAHAADFEWQSVPAVLTLGGLLYSAPTVFAWIRTFKSGVPAFGFVLLLEGLMVTSKDPVVTYAALVMLIAINAISTACALARGSR